MAKFEQGTERDGFKRALMAAFMSAHKSASGGPHPTQTPEDKMTKFNPDKRAPGLMPGGNQAYKMPSSNEGENVLAGGKHPSPATTATAPANHNNDTRSISLLPTGHQADKIKLTGGSATNAHELLPTGHQANKIKLPKNQNVDSRGLRGR